MLEYRFRRALLVSAMVSGFIVTAVASGPPQADVEVRCDAGDSFQAALDTVSTGGRIIVRSGTCTGNFSITRNVRIQGEGFDRAALKAADAERPVVQIARGVVAAISGLTISGGRVGISSLGRVDLVFAAITDNVAGGIQIRDGGILVSDRTQVIGNHGPGIDIVRGDATLSGGVISDNVTDGVGGAGMLIAGGHATITLTRFDKNEAANDGGGLLATAKSSVTLDRVRFFHNTARLGHGGGIALRSSIAEITGGSFFENTSTTGSGGGIATLDRSDVRIANTTIAANSASSWMESGAGGSGGALYVDKTSNATLVHATLVDNAARIAAGIAASNTVTLQASLLAGNRGALESGECGGPGRIVSRGWNLLQSPGRCRYVMQHGDLLGALPHLGPYGTYGAVWNTVPLKGISPAIDRVPLGQCHINVDQRQRSRMSGNGCDTGAFERQPDDATP